MHKILLFLCLLSSIMTAQMPKYDTLISNTAYKSYYSKDYLNPVILTYTLYQGGGECSRTSFYFKNDIKTLQTSTTKDYAKSGYEKGHLANAEDFAYNCELDEMTFRYYNCVPQTASLNRGIWKRYENEIRKFSQTDSLFIICYNIFGDKKINNVAIPDTCVKFVFSYKTRKFIYALKFTNTENAQCFPMSISEMRKYRWLIKLY